MFVFWLFLKVFRSLLLIFQGFLKLPYHLNIIFFGDLFGEDIPSILSVNLTGKIYK